MQGIPNISYLLFHVVYGWVEISYFVIFIFWISWQIIPSQQSDYNKSIISSQIITVQHIPGSEVYFNITQTCNHEYALAGRVLFGTYRQWNQTNKQRGAQTMMSNERTERTHRQWCQTNRQFVFFEDKKTDRPTSQVRAWLALSSLSPNQPKNINSCAEKKACI